MVTLGLVEHYCLVFWDFIGAYLIVILKNFFYRWSSRPPNLINPSPIQITKKKQLGLTQIFLKWEGSTSVMNSTAIWIIGKTPRFLLNLALALCVHTKSVIINEVKKSAMEALTQQGTPQTTSIYYATACRLSLGHQGKRSPKIILINPTIPLPTLCGIEREEKYILVSYRIGADRVNFAHSLGFSVVKMTGGMKFKGNEMTLPRGNSKNIEHRGSFELKTSSGGSKYTRILPAGCKQCMRGEKLVFFVGGDCDFPESCRWYCPISDKRKGKPVMFINEQIFGDWDDLWDEIEKADAQGMSITGGDPLVSEELRSFVVDTIRRVKEHYGQRFTFISTQMA